MDYLKSSFVTYPSPYDRRDYVYKESAFPYQQSVDLREWDSPVEDQSQLGSCVGNAIAAAYEHMVKRQYPDKFVDLSRLFIYYNARASINEELLDAGTTVKSGLQGLKAYGVCDESLWPYNIDKFDDKPTAEAYANAERRKITSYTRLFSNVSVIDALRYGKPVVFGIDVFDSFMKLTASDSIVTYRPLTDQLAGGHAMCLVGYDLKSKLFLSKNSFGTDWGDKGYCWIPFKYFETYSYDKWVFSIPEQK